MGMKMEPQQPQPQEQQYFAQQDQMSLEGRIGGNMNQQVQYGGIEIPYAVKQEGLGTSPVNMGYASPPEATTSGTQHKMTILELRENQEIMQQQQLTGQQQWQQQ